MRVDQPQHAGIVRSCGPAALQDGVVDAGKELAHIALQDIGVAAGKLLGAVQGAVGAFADPVGVRISDEAALEDRLDQVAQGVVDDPVAERGGRDQAALGFVDIKAVYRRRAGSVNVSSSSCRASRLSSRWCSKAATLGWPRLPLLALR